MNNYQCKYCGRRFGSITSMASTTCARHPSGSHKGRHALYEGSVKPRYTCKYCGTSNSSISGLSLSTCTRHPNGPHKGKHAPAL